MLFILNHNYQCEKRLVCCSLPRFQLTDYSPQHSLKLIYPCSHAQRIIPILSSASAKRLMRFFALFTFDRLAYSSSTICSRVFLRHRFSNTASSNSPSSLSSLNLRMCRWRHSLGKCKLPWCTQLMHCLSSALQAFLDSMPITPALSMRRACQAISSVQRTIMRVPGQCSSNRWQSSRLHIPGRSASVIIIFGWCCFAVSRSSCAWQAVSSHWYSEWFSRMKPSKASRQESILSAITIVMADMCGWFGAINV